MNTARDFHLPSFALSNLTLFEIDVLCARPPSYLSSFTITAEIPDSSRTFSGDHQDLGFNTSPIPLVNDSQQSRRCPPSPVPFHFSSPTRRSSTEKGRGEEGSKDSLPQRGPILCTAKLPAQPSTPPHHQRTPRSSSHFVSHRHLLQIVDRSEKKATQSQAYHSAAKHKGALERRRGVKVAKDRHPFRPDSFWPRHVVG